MGKGTNSGVFTEELKEATLTEDELMRRSKYIRPLILGRITNSQPPEYMEELNAITQAECEDKGWLTGPRSVESLDEEFNKQWISVE